MFIVRAKWVIVKAKGGDCQSHLINYCYDSDRNILKRKNDCLAPPLRGSTKSAPALLKTCKTMKARQGFWWRVNNISSPPGLMQHTADAYNQLKNSINPDNPKSGGVG